MTQVSPGKPRPEFRATHRATFFPGLVRHRRPRPVRHRTHRHNTQHSGTRSPVRHRPSKKHCAFPRTRERSRLPLARPERVRSSSSLGHPLVAGSCPDTAGPRPLDAQPPPPPPPPPLRRQHPAASSNEPRPSRQVQHVPHAPRPHRSSLHRRRRRRRPVIWPFPHSPIRPFRPRGHSDRLGRLQATERHPLLLPPAC